MNSGGSEWASERTNERSGARERSEQCGTSEWVIGSSKWVIGLSKWANGGANSPVLYASISESFYPLWNVSITGRPKAIDGQWYPNPAHQYYNGSLEIGRPSTPKETMSCRSPVEKSVHPYVCPIVCPPINPSLHPSRALQWLAVGGGGERQMGGQMDGQLDIPIDFSWILPNIDNFGAAAQKLNKRWFSMDLFLFYPTIDHISSY